MSAKHIFGELSVSELQQIMKLTFEEALCADEMEPWLARLYGTLAADVGFELWSREQARIEQRRECGRPAGGRMVRHIESIH
jgi:hypothetical protein